MLRVTAKEIKGVVSMPPTPATDDGGSWRTTNSVDFDRTKDMVSKLVASGVGSFAFCGTTGGCMSLLWEEKRDFIATAVQTVNKRVPVFAGCTALGTKEVIRQMRGMRDVGAEGAFIGLPLWQTPTLENSVQFFADLSEAVPDMGIMIYSNSTFFKSDFLPEFWAGCASKAPTVITNKIAHGMTHLEKDIAGAGHQITFVPGAGGAAYQAYKRAPGKIQAIWATSAGPEVYVALANAIIKQDTAMVEQINNDLKTLPPGVADEGPANRGGGPPAVMNWQARMDTGMARYNTQWVNLVWKYSGYADIGPMRPPYKDFDEESRKRLETFGKAFGELRKKYMPSKVAGK